MSEETNCKFCNEPVKIYEKRKNVTFSNIEQKPSILYFCSKKCKSDWIHRGQEKQNWNQLEKEFFQKTGEFPYQEGNEYEKWLDKKLEHLKLTLDKIINN